MLTPTNRWPRLAGGMTALASLWFLASPLLGHMGPPRPCIVVGGVLGVCAFMFAYRPAARRGWAVIAAATSVLALFLGAGAIPPAGLGLVGAVVAVVWNERDQTAR